MKQAKNKYVGCLATKIHPDTYNTCLHDYNNPKSRYEQYKIIPYNALKQQQYENELSNKNFDQARALKLSDKAKISYLPKGVRQYIDAHPHEFSDYLHEIKSEAQYLDAINRAMRNEKDVNQRARIRKQLMGVIEDNETASESDDDKGETNMDY